MGLLDDAIREHLEFKRRRGADAGEITRAEREALGAVRHGPDGEPDLASIPAPPPPVPPRAAYDDDAPAHDVESDWAGDTAILPATEHEPDAYEPPPVPSAYESQSPLAPVEREPPPVPAAADEPPPVPAAYDPPAPVSPDPPGPPAERDALYTPSAERDALNTPPAERDALYAPPAERDALYTPPAERVAPDTPPAERDALYTLSLIHISEPTRPY